MTHLDRDGFSASESALGYLYQSRFALYQLLKFPEEYAVLIEKDDDLDFSDEQGHKTLASLKHKKPGERLTDLSTDFWKSVRIWLSRYKASGRISSHLQFFLYTTNETAADSFLSSLIPLERSDISTILEKAEEALADSAARIIVPIKEEFDLLSEDEKKDFLKRIFIFDNSPRIDDLPDLIIKQHMRMIRSEFRQSAFERLEGWWNELVIKLLTNTRVKEVYGHEISDKLSSINNEYRADNLPIDFRGKKPDGEIDVDNDTRLFVVQLKKLGLSPARIERAICNYYRAFNQRSAWARENVLLEGEVEIYEELLVDEWSEYKEVAFEKIKDDSSEDMMQKAGRDLYNWAQFETDRLRIRPEVSEPYVVRGNFHILANEKPLPRIYWHPLFLERLKQILLQESV
ncbi:MAG: ABC-three component system protein [Syntrophothermus sp.]